MRSFILTIVALTLVFVGRGAAQGPEAYVKGLEALEKASWADAVEQFGKAIDANGENPDYFTARGVANTLAEKFPQAIKDLERSLRLREGHYGTRIWLAVALRMSGDIAKAPMHFVHGKDLPIEYASFLYNDMAMHYWQVKHRGAAGNATKDFSKAGAWFAERIKGRATPSVDVGVDLFKRALERMDRKEYATAVTDLESILASKPDQPEVLLQYAWCKFYIDDVSGARTYFTRVLTLQTRSAEAFRGRAMAQARLGRIDRAVADMARAAEIDPKEAADLGPLLKAIEKTLPTNSPADCLKELYAAARNGDDFATLVDRATAVRLAMNAKRRHFDEEYQGRISTLEDGIRELPKNPYSYVALAEYLHRHARGIGERVEPRGTAILYRRQTLALQAAEIARAESLCDQALKLDPDVAPAIRIKIAIRLEAGNFDAAAALLAKLDPSVISSDVELSLANHAVASKDARQLRGKAHALKNPEFGSPSQFDLEDAAKLEKEAADMMAKAFDLVEKAAAATDEKTAEGQYARAQPRRLKGDLVGTRSCFEKAIELKPDYREALLELAGTLTEMKQSPAQAQELRSRAVNVLQTTAVVWLRQVWAEIAQTRWTTARATLDRAEQDDPADARIAAYRASIAIGEEKWDDAIRYFRAAVALEESRAKHMGTSFTADGKGVRPVEEFGLGAMARLNLGRLYLQLNKSDAALTEFRANTALNARMSRDDRTAAVLSSMVPDPTTEANTVPEAENAARLLAWSHLGAGKALAALKRPADAAKEFEAVRTLAANTQFFTKPGRDHQPMRSLDEPKAAATQELARLAIAANRLDDARRYLNESGSWSKPLEQQRKALEEELRRRRMR